MWFLYFLRLPCFSFFLSSLKKKRRKSSILSFTWMTRGVRKGQLVKNTFYLISFCNWFFLPEGNYRCFVKYRKNSFVLNLPFFTIQKMEKNTRQRAGFSRSLKRWLRFQILTNDLILDDLMPRQTHLSIPCPIYFFQNR